MNTPQILITAAGLDDDPFLIAGFDTPKNLVDYSGISILETAIETYLPLNDSPLVIIRKDEDTKWGTSQLINKNFPKVNFQTINHATQGALCTALMSIEFLDVNSPLLICPGDSTVNSNIQQIYKIFLDCDASAATLLFSSDDPRYSYARIEENFSIIEMAEKNVISEFASSGLFMFKKAIDFIQAGEWVLMNNMTFKGEYFLSSTLNYLITKGRKVQGITLPESDKYTPLGRPADLIKELIR